MSADRVELGKRFAALLERAEKRSDETLRGVLRLTLLPLSKPAASTTEACAAIESALELLDRDSEIDPNYDTRCPHCGGTPIEPTEQVCTWLWRGEYWEHQCPAALRLPPGSH